MLLTAIKYGNVLQPCEEAGLEELAKIPNGATVMVEVKRPRNINHHRLYFALVQIVFDNTDREKYASREDVHNALKISAGIRKPLILANGEVATIPGSIAWGAMDQTRFAEFFDRVCDIIAKYVLPGLSDADLRARVSEMTGIMV